jgi:DNA gyrase subunit A
VDSIRIAGRNTQGVTILRTAGDERVVSVERVVEPAGATNVEEGSGDGPDSD